MKASLVTVVLLVGLLGVLAWLTLGYQQVECKVCMDFKGRQNCATAAAATREEAIRTGRSTACGLIVAGVRDSFACDAAQPASIACQ